MAITFGQKSNHMKNPVKNLFMVTALLVLSSCSNDDNGSIGDCSEEFWTQRVQDEATAFFNAANAFSEDPSVANCNALKATGNAYIDALEDARPCVPNSELNEFEMGLDDARESINETLCSELGG